MLDPTAVLIAIEVMAGLFLLLIGVGRAVLRRYTVVRHTRRFIRGPAASGETPVATGNAVLRRLDALVAFVMAHRRESPIALFTVALVVVGMLLRGWTFGVGMALLGLLAVYWTRRQRLAQRRRLLEQQLVPVLRTIATGAESGLSLHQAMDRIVHDAPRPIADEFAQALRAVDLGTTLPIALSELATRAGSDDYEFFASVVTVQYRTGGSLATLLTTLAENIQERLEFAAEVGALTAQARFSGWILAALPFGVFGLIMVASPGYVGPLVNTLDGRLLLIFAGGLLGVGLLAIRSISQVDV